MLFRMIMFQLRVAIPPVGLMPVELLPIESVTDQDMFFEQGNRLVIYIKEDLKTLKCTIEETTGRISHFFGLIRTVQSVFRSWPKKFFKFLVVR